MKVDLCRLDDVPTEGALSVEFFGRTLQVVRTGGGRAVAYADVCTHFRGPLECRDGAFVCAWHGAVFDRDSGERRDGPAPAGSRLMRLSTVEEEGMLRYVWAERE